MELRTFSGAALAAALLFGYTAMNAAAQVPAGAQEETVLQEAADIHADIHIAKGDELLLARKYARARKEYQEAAKLMRADGIVPEDAVQRIARSLYYERKHRSAVSVLDGLAKEAAQAGEVAIQTRALANATWLLWFDCTQRRCPGGKLEIQNRQRQIERLLSSPYLDDGERRKLAVRVGVSPDVVMLAKAKRTRVRA